MNIDDILQTPDQRSALYLVEFRQGPNYWRYSSAEDYVLNGSLYRKNVMSIAKMAHSVAESPSAAEITLRSDDEVIKIFDAFLPVEPVTCTIYHVERNDTTATPRTVRSGIVMGVSDNDNGLSVIRVMAYSQGMNRSAPWQMQQVTCVLATYGSQCGVNPEDFKSTAVGVSVLDDVTIQAGAFDNADPHWFDAGWIRCRSTREIRFILTQGPAGALTLSYPFAYASASDTFDAYAGDMHTGDVCKNKFHNKARFMGFEKIPTTNLFKTGLKN